MYEWIQCMAADGITVSINSSIILLKIMQLFSAKHTFTLMLHIKFYKLNRIQQIYMHIFGNHNQYTYKRST